MTMVAIDYIHIFTSLFFGMAAIYKLRHKQAEHFFTRSLVFIWFALTVFDRHMNVDFVRIMSNYVIMLVPFIELVSPMFRKYWKNKQ
jgi:hypothetical protein